MSLSSQPAQRTLKWLPIPLPFAPSCARCLQRPLYALVIPSLLSWITPSITVLVKPLWHFMCSVILSYKWHIPCFLQGQNKYNFIIAFVYAILRLNYDLYLHGTYIRASYSQSLHVEYLHVFLIHALVISYGIMEGVLWLFFLPKV